MGFDGSVLARLRMIAAAFLIATVAGMPWQTFAQETAPAEQVATLEYDVPAGPLGRALMRFATQTGVQLVYPASMTEGLETKGVAGRYEPREALSKLLEGTGLTYRYTADKSITLEPATKSDRARVLGPVRVQGAEVTGETGANGSTDVTATEGTKSYSTAALSIGGKAPRSMRETPQSVSVLTRQRIDDQNLTDVTQALSQSTGVTLVQGGSSAETRIYSRGYQITSFQLDGGPPMSSGYDNYSLPDLAQYDHVELLRGADGLFSGAGNPGGTVNLVRKRPLDHKQIIINGYAGSWNNYRSEVDVTGPLGYDGKLRGRFVSAYEDRDYFYNVAEQNKTLLYGTLEADLTPTTLLTFGGSFERRHTVPWASGLMRYKDGGDLKLPRSTCLCTDWSRWDFETPEMFLRLEQAIGENWSAKLNLTKRRQTSAEKFGSVNGNPVPVFPNDPYTTLLTGQAYGFSNEQTLAELSLSGAFDLLKRHHEIVLGANWQDVDGSGRNYGTQGLYTEYPDVDVFTFDPHAYPEPATPASSAFAPVNEQKQYGIYASLNIQLLDDLRFRVGARYSEYEYKYKYLAVYSFGEYMQSEHRKESDVITPYYALTYDLSKALSLYASYAEIYSSQANYYKGPPPGAEPLEPLTGGNYEVGIKGEWMDGRLNASLAAYRIKRTNGAVSDPNYESYAPGPEPGSYCCFFAESEQLSRGFDAEITGQILPGWEIFAGYTFNLNEYSAGYAASTKGRPLISQAPKHLFKMWTTASLPGGLSRWRVGGGVNAQTKAYESGYYEDFDDEGNSVATTNYDYVMGFRAIYSARVEYQVDDHWSASLNGNNLFDKVYYQTVGGVAGGSWYGEPRNFMLTLRGTF